MHKINIIVDIDNTLADTQGAFLEYITKKSGRQIPLSSIRTELRGDGIEWYEPYAREFIFSTSYEDTVLRVKPYPGSMEAMELLNTLGDVHIVSSRINNWHDATHQWLKNHNFTEKVRSIHLRDVNEKSVDFKKRIIAQLQGDYLFDDSMDIAIELKDIVREIYLIDQPWNEDLSIDYEKIRRHDDLLKAAESLVQILDENPLWITP